MATDTQKQAGAAATVTNEKSLLEAAIAATELNERPKAEDLFRNLMEQAFKGTVKFKKNLTVTFKEAIREIDDQMSLQLAAIMHHSALLQLEGSWRGLKYLVANSNISEQLKVRVLNATKQELADDLAKADEYDQSVLFKQIYDNEFGMAGGRPYGVLVGDYEITKHNEDVEFLDAMSHVAAAAFAPFIAGASHDLLGLKKDFRELSKPRELESIFEGPEYIKWRGFRESEDSRFVSLALPRVLARVPYGEKTKRISEFNYEEAPSLRQMDGPPVPRPLEHNEYCWMNASYVLAARLTNAFDQYGWCTAIRGKDGGGRVEQLPTHVFMSDDGDMDQKCPTEIGITDRRDGELSKLGFIPLLHYKNTDYAVFFSGQTVQKLAKWDRPEAQANAEISARLPYVLATSRFAHFLKFMGRDLIGMFKEAEDVERLLNRWITNYVNANPAADQEMKARYPLRAAKVEVKEIPGKPGSYNAVAWLRPWLQMEELTASLRMVASIPKGKS
jgi:type VI secretion system protein ImpC